MFSVVFYIATTNKIFNKESCMCTGSLRLTRAYVTILTWLIRIERTLIINTCFKSPEVTERQAMIYSAFWFLCVYV